MSPRSFATFLTEVKSDETLARDLRSVLISANVNDLSAVVAEFAHRKGMAVDVEALLESLQESMNTASAPEFSDGEIEIVKGPIMGRVIASYLLQKIQTKREKYSVKKKQSSKRRKGYYLKKVSE